ncbi:MAG: maleylacetoacetate isomerase [Proteobacteria bacterium]|nr:maleylacetoacetate isomerase [Pseudomonadota bacterium]
MFKLYDYFRSSACYRVRIALNLKELPYEQISVHLTKDGGHQLQAHYKSINPQQLVPALLLIDSNQVITQSLAIIEYLEETFPAVPLLPSEVVARANVRAFAQVIACDIHPINNLRVLKYLKHHFHVSDEQKMAWYFNWLTKGFDTLEKLLEKQHIGPYCFGEAPTLADVCLIPQVYNALRFDYSLEHYPYIRKIHAHANNHPAFIKALPENQPDSE